MSDCDRVRELIPWYASGTLSVPETQEVTVHLADCGTCRKDLAEILRLKGAVENEARCLPRLPEDVWKRVAAEAYGRPIAKLDIGSFLLGFAFSASVRRGNVPVHGDLKLLGRKIRLFSVGQEEEA